MVEGEENSMDWTKWELSIVTLQMLYSEEMKSRSSTTAKSIADVLQLSGRTVEIDNVLLEHCANGFVDVIADGYCLTNKGLEYLKEQLPIDC
jgi:hypothetical protein